MRPGLTRDEMRKLEKALRDRMDNGADFDRAWEAVKRTVFPGVDPVALETGFKDWALRRLGLAPEKPAVELAEPPKKSKR